MTRAKQKSISTDLVIAKACQAAFGKPLVTNVLRGQIVEAIVALALEPEWTWCASDYSSWDFERSDGIRLEVKQASLRQTWAPPAHGRISTSFDIKERSGRWEGATFVTEAGRPAHLYIFAFHGVSDDSADHRAPHQWQFFVVPTNALPRTQRLSLANAMRLATPVDIADLSDTVSRTAKTIAV